MNTNKYAPSPMKPAVPRDTKPLKPKSKLRPKATTANITVNPNILTVELAIIPTSLSNGIIAKTIPNIRYLNG